MTVNTSDGRQYLKEDARRYRDVLEHHFRPILRYFSDDRITDIEVNPDGMIFAHYLDGSAEELSDAYLSPKSIEAVATLLASSTQNDVNSSSPSIGAIWPDPPYRIHIIIPPAVEQASMVIRRFSPVVFPLAYYIENGTCTIEQAERMRALILARRNIVISGETGSGKTTLLNSLIREIPSEQRLYIVEDTRELQCSAPNRVSILTGDTYSTRQAIKDALRFRPDRIVVGEVRDGAALDLLEAWNTGHPGGLCSIHANSPDTVKLRFRSLIQQVSMSGQSDLIDATVDAVIQVTLCSDGKRRITEIREFRK